MLQYEHLIIIIKSSGRKDIHINTPLEYKIAIIYSSTAEIRKSKPSSIKAEGDSTVGTAPLWNNPQSVQSWSKTSERTGSYLCVWEKVCTYTVKSAKFDSWPTVRQ